MAQVLIATAFTWGMTAMGASLVFIAKGINRRFMTGMLGSRNTLDVISGTRLAVLRQVAMPQQELAALYVKLGLPVELAAADSNRNRELLLNCYEAGRRLVL